MNLNTNSFFNSTEVHISSRMNEYLKKNFGYEVEGDFDTLKEAKQSLEAEQVELKSDYMSAKYIENMLMIETISSLLKAHGEQPSLSPSHKQEEVVEEEDEEEKGKKKLNAVQEDKYSDLNPTNKFGYFGGPGFYSNDGSTYTEPHYDDFDIRQHNKDNPEDKIKLNNWDDFNLKMRYHKKDGKRVQGYGGMGYNVSFHGNPKDVEAFAMKNLDAERYSGDNIPEAVKEDDDYMIKRKDGEYDKDEIRQMQYQQNVADPLNREIDSSQKAMTIEVDYDLELDTPKSQNHLLKKHYKEMRKFNVFISMPEWQEGPKDSGFGQWTAKVRGSKKNLLGWLKAWEFDYDKEQLADMGLGESVEQMNEASHSEAKAIYDLVGSLGAGEIELAQNPIFHDLIRYLDSDTINKFVADFRKKMDDKDFKGSVDFGQYETVNEDDEEEKGPEHYRYVNDSQLSRVQDRLRLTISDLDHAIQYRAKNSHLFFNTGDKAGTGDLYGIKEKLEKIDDEWDDQTELYGM